MKETDTILHEHLKDMTLLCVDDSRTITMIYTSVYENLFKEVLVAQNGKEALELIDRHPIDIIITDYEMPQMNGIEMISYLQEHNNTKPIIFVTAVEEKQVVVQALNLGVQNFLYKPFDVVELNLAVEKAAKMVLANQLLQEEQEAHEQLKKEKRYMEYQEELSFRKELMILRNDFYYQRDGKARELLIDLMYMPLDTLSGDAYSIRALDENQILFLVVDGMGKGLSASLSAMLFTSFVNYRIDEFQTSRQAFNLKLLIEESIHFIQKILLEEEVLSAEFIVYDKCQERLTYALYSMPELLLMQKDGSVKTIKSNNAPINKYLNQVKINELSLEAVDKLLFASDGLVENRTKKGLYAQYIIEDFKQASTREDFKQSFLSHITQQEDDITFIFLSFLDRTVTHAAKQFPAKVSAVDEAISWYEDLLEAEPLSVKQRHNANLIFNELFMNAFEHGSLGIGYQEKEQLILEDTYYDHLEALGQKSDRVIKVAVHYLEDKGRYLLTTIEDQGNGFDTQNLSMIFRNRDKFNGKGVLISRKLSDGIYYNQKGNSVLFITKCDAP